MLSVTSRCAVVPIKIFEKPEFKLTNFAFPTSHTLCSASGFLSFKSPRNVQPIKKNEKRIARKKSVKLCVRLRLSFVPPHDPSRKKKRDDPYSCTILSRKLREELPDVTKKYTQRHTFRKFGLYFLCYTNLESRLWKPRCVTI